MLQKAEGTAAGTAHGRLGIFEKIKKKLSGPTRHHLPPTLEPYCGHLELPTAATKSLIVALCGCQV